MPRKLGSDPMTIARTRTACSRKTRSQHPPRKERRDGRYQRRPRSVSLENKLVAARRAKTVALQRGITLASVSDRGHQHHTFWWCYNIASTHTAADAQFSINRGSLLRVKLRSLGGRPGSRLCLHERTFLRTAALRQKLSLARSKSNFRSANPLRGHVFSPLQNRGFPVACPQA